MVFFKITLIYYYFLFYYFCFLNSHYSYSTVYIVHCTLYSIHWTLYDVQCIRHTSVLYTPVQLYRCTLYSAYLLRIKLVHTNICFRRLKWIRFIVCVVHWQMYSVTDVQCTLTNDDIPMIYIMLTNMVYTMYTVTCTTYTIQCTVYSVDCIQCTLFTIQCTLYAIQHPYITNSNVYKWIMYLHMYTS